MSDHPQSTPLSELQPKLAEVRAGLLAEPGSRRTGALRFLFNRTLEDEVFWFDDVGHLAKVESQEGVTACLADLVLALLFPAQWPPEGGQEGGGR